MGLSYKFGSEISPYCPDDMASTRHRAKYTGRRRVWHMTMLQGWQRSWAGRRVGIAVSRFAPAFLEKTPSLHSFAGAIARRSFTGNELVTTNMGLTWHLRVDVSASKSLLLYGRHDDYLEERATLELVMHLIEHASCFVDVGANEGVFSLSVATASGASQMGGGLHVFEPDQDLHERLRTNFRQNKIVAQLNQKAVSATLGELTFYRNLSDDLSGSLNPMFSKTHQLQETLVETTPLSVYFEHHDLTNACVKVDVEGAGADVWGGAVDCADKISWLIFEMLEPEISAGLPRKIITQGGYFAYYIRDFDLVNSPDGAFEYRHPFYNWLFCRKSPIELTQMLANSAFRVKFDQPDR